VYPSVRDRPPGLRDGAAAPVDRRPWAGVGRNVIFLGLTSLFTDVSSEMVAATLPLYVLWQLGFTPLQFGVLDGLSQGVTALVRVAGGFVADRRGRYKEVAGAGYALSALCKLGLLAAGGAWGAVAGVLLLDRIGKGVRTAPRDALISLSSAPERLAGAFGIHRALDTAGAMGGPLVAFGLLALAPGAFDAVFVASFCVAVLGLGLLLLFVENRPAGAAIPTGSPVSLRALAEPLAHPRFRALVLAGTALALATISDGFVYLSLQRRTSLSVGVFPLLYVATSAVYLVLAVPAGRLADRIGRTRVFVGGHVLVLAVYSALLQPAAGITGVAACLLLLGAAYAATDGVLMAMASGELPRACRSSGLALLTSATALARLFASVAFGAMWTWWGQQLAIGLHLAGLAAAVALAAILLGRERNRDAATA
jgi:MFS family permease